MTRSSRAAQQLIVSYLATWKVTYVPVFEIGHNVMEGSKYFVSL